MRTTAPEFEGGVATIRQSQPQNRGLPAPTPRTCPSPEMWKEMGVEGRRMRCGRRRSAA